MAQRKKKETQIAICINNTDYGLSLEPRKVYQVLPDVKAESNGYVRVIDETGEDYLFPSECFVLLVVPKELSEAVLKAA